MSASILGVFCPFWSREGPHFILPHFQGMFRSMGMNATILDLNIECAEALPGDWSLLSSNSGGLWSDPYRIVKVLERASLTERLLQAVKAARPSRVVFLSVNVANYHVVRYLIRQLRSDYSSDELQIAAGGPLCLHLEKPSEAFPGADFVWSGTLESALLHLTGCLAPEPGPGAAIPRFRPDFTGIDMGRYACPERLTYLLNYGCRFQCRFCHEGSHYGREVARTTAGLAGELLGLVRSLPTVRYVRFFDSSLNSDHQQFLALLDELHGVDLRWGGYLTPTPLIGDTVARRMAEAGCLGVNVGVESGSTAVRRLMAKPASRIEGVESCLRALHHAGLDVSINLIIGYPGETDKYFEDTLTFLDRLAPILSAVAVGKTGIYVGTPLFEQVATLGIELNGDREGEFVFNHWSLADGSNTPEIRATRLLRAEERLASMGLMNARTAGMEDPGLRALKNRMGSVCVNSGSPSVGPLVGNSASPLSIPH